MAFILFIYLTADLTLASSEFKQLFVCEAVCSVLCVYYPPHLKTSSTADNNEAQSALTLLFLTAEKVGGKNVTAPDSLGVGWVWHMRPRLLLHGLLVDLVFGQGNRPQRTHPQRWGDADL